jgi:F5/8 type C domain/Bacterial alpha-L-rhamnosidase 6 hairpin glycosidase domain
VLATALILGVCVTTAARSATPESAPPPRIVDAFEDVRGWTARPSDGVELTVRADSGVTGHALRLDFRFVHGGGYALVHKDVAIDLPDDYEFRFALRGLAPVNNLEFKLVDSTGANVWWSNQRDFHYPARWSLIRLPKRRIPFAWGPTGGGEIRHVAAIEFAITAGSGGTGTVWIDDLTLRERRPPLATAVLIASATRSTPGHPATAAIDGISSTYWASGAGARPQFTLDLGVEREFGGIVLDWMPGRHLANYAVQVAEDGGWRTVREVHGGNGGRDALFLPESEAQVLRIRALGTAPAAGCALREISAEPLEWSSSLATFFHNLAKEAPRGSYPRAITGEQSFWTVVGRGEGRGVGLINEDGMLETGKAAFSIEPFLYTGGRLIGWNDVHARPSLAEGDLPIPSVEWNSSPVRLTITAFAEGDERRGSMIARYRMRNTGRTRRTGTLFLALRPFQVNPPTQFLNTPGGMAPIHAIERAGRVVRVNGRDAVASLTTASGFGAATFDQGDVVESLRSGVLPPTVRATDSLDCASGALAYAFDLAPGASREVDVLVPLEGALDPAWLVGTDVTLRQRVATHEVAARSRWRERLDRVTIELPDSDVVRTLRSQLAYVLVNRDSVAIRPGTRSYARSWIRDGMLTSSALLRLGQMEAVRDFIAWFTPSLYRDGKVPCCVDERGSDPVPELDSNGEFIALIAEYYRATGDRAWLERQWPAVRAAASYLDTLRAQRRTAEWRAPGKEEFFGLLPPSISHEGYSAKPMHSYWDDLFALRGFKDATTIATALGKDDDARRFAASRDEFQHDLSASIAAAMRVHKIDYIPGCADLGDFDATSTTIALDPVEAAEMLPRGALERTFERYWTFFRDRRDGRVPWEAFTPYEMRTIGAFVRLGWRDRAHELLAYFMAYRRPLGWNHWAEVVWHDERTPKFIGDMPHTWVGTDFARSVLDMVAYPRERDEAIVVGSGLSWDWVSRGTGVRVRNLPTPYGTLNYLMRARGDSLYVGISGTCRVPAGGLVVLPPSHTPFRTAMLDGVEAPISADGAVIVRRLPAVLQLRP